MQAQIGKLWTAAFLLTATIPPAMAQITVGPNVLVSKARPDFLQSELMADADPIHPRRLMACSLIFNTTRPEARANDSWGVAVYTSQDSGKTWEMTFEQYPLMDPACTYGGDGTAYVLAFDSSSILLFRSPDGGQKWEPPTVIRSMDRPYVTVDHSGSKYNGNVYLHGSIGGTGSMDGGPHPGGTRLYPLRDSGRGIGDPIQREATLGLNVANGNGIVLSDGTLVIVFFERHLDPEDRLEAEVRVRQPSGRVRIVTSADAGRSMSNATTVSDYYIHAYPWRAPGSIIPWIAVDGTQGPFKDRLYVVWSDRRSGQDQILFSSSADRGKTWSQPMLLDEDRPPVVPGLSLDDQLPVVAVNSHGVIGVAWYDHRNASDPLGWNIRFRASLDGGDSWLPSVKVSEQPHAFAEKAKWPIYVATAPEAGGRTGIDIKVQHMLILAGDTSGLAVDMAGVFHPVWVDNRTGVPQLWTSAVSVPGEACVNGDPEFAKLREVSDRVALQFENPAIDRATNNITMQARIKNKSTKAVTGPFVVRVGSVSSDLGISQITNADNGSSGPGAIWRWSQDTLQPNATSELRELKFHVKDMRSFAAPGFKFDHGIQGLGLVHLDVRILAPEDKP